MALADDVRAAREEIREVRTELQKANALGEGYRAEINILHEQINGTRGLSTTLDKLAAEVHGLRKAAYWLAALIVASSIGFAFSVLTFLQ